MHSDLFTCPCCGFKTLENNVRNSFEICTLCDWEDDGIQYDDPDYRGGANENSLREEQYHFLKKKIVHHKFYKDPSWNILSKASKQTKIKTDFIVNQKSGI